MKQNNRGRYILGSIKYLLTPTSAHYNKKGIIFVTILFQHIKLNKYECKRNH